MNRSRAWRDLGGRIPETEDGDAEVIYLAAFRPTTGTMTIDECRAACRSAVAAARARAQQQEGA